MLIKALELGPLGTNCYIVADEQTLDCAVIDPAGDASALLDYLEQQKYRCRFLLLTHTHFDHVGAVDALLAETGAQLMLHARDNGLSFHEGEAGFTAPDGAAFYREGDVISLGSISFTVLETPGHTPGSVCLLARCAGEDAAALFTGDTLFRDSCGRTDFPHGSTEDMFASLRRLHDLSGDYEVYPGHGLATSLSRERSRNYFMLMATKQ